VAITPVVASINLGDIGLNAGDGRIMARANVPLINDLDGNRLLTRNTTAGITDGAGSISLVPTDAATDPTDFAYDIDIYAANKRVVRLEGVKLPSSDLTVNLGDLIDLDPSTDPATYTGSLANHLADATAAHAFTAPAPTGVKATDEANVQPLVTAAQAASGTVVLQAGTYVMDITTARMDRQPRIVGQGEKLTLWNGTLSIEGEPGSFSGGYLADFGFVGTRSAGVACLRIRGAISVRWDRLGFNATSDIGILFENDSTHLFTEACAGQAHFSEVVKKAVEYRVSTGGNPSFHGCGLLEGSTINQANSDTGPKVHINTGAEPYNAPMSVTVWARTAQPIMRHDGAKTSTFYGDMKVELLPSNAYCVIGDPAGFSIPFVGSLSRRGKEVRVGSLSLGESVLTDSGIPRVRRGGARVDQQGVGTVGVIGPDGTPEWVPRRRVNRCINPVLGTNATGYGAYNSATVARVADTTLGAAYAYRITTTSTSEVQGFTYLVAGSDLAQGQVKTVAFDIYSPVDLIAYAGGRFGLSGSPGVAEVGEFGATGDIEYIAANTVHRVRRVVTVPAPNPAGSITHEGMYLRVNTVGGMPAIGTAILVGNVVIEDGITPGSKFYGGDGAAQWASTAHASQSIAYPSLPTAGVEQAYTPSLTNVTLGDGVLTGYYSKVGSRVTGSVYFKMGSTSAITGTIGFGLPADAPAVAGSLRRFSGEGIIFDDSAAEPFEAFVQVNGTTALSVYCLGGGNGGYTRRLTANATRPIAAWATNDYVLISFQYESTP